uniref:ShKT domain-containing protein n=1 Tax=Rhabditophanes sp. KR3021 TaxID=114890 RepID=A0AC35TXW8_9BILA
MQSVGYYVCTLPCTQDFQCRENPPVGSCKAGTDIVTGKSVKACPIVSADGQRCSPLIPGCAMCNLYISKCRPFVLRWRECSQTTLYCLHSTHGCNPTPGKADGSSTCLQQCTADTDCNRLRAPSGICKLLPDVKSLIPVKFCTVIDVTNTFASTGCTNKLVNEFTGECVRDLIKIKEPCSKGTAQCAATLGCNPYISNVCAQTCTTNADCFDSTNSYTCTSGIDTVDSWPLMFCQVNKPPECSLNTECTTKDPLFECNLFTLQCSRPIGPLIGNTCTTGGLPCYESVCNSFVNNICTLLCTVDANCGSPSNPGSCDIATDITSSGSSIKICKLTKPSPSCDGSGGCTAPLVCSKYTWTCEQPPGIGDACTKGGISCGAPFVCNSLTVTGTSSICVTPCTVDGNCIRNGVAGKCTDSTDSTANGGPVKVCAYDDTTSSCISDDECPERVVCNLYTLKCESTPTIGEPCIDGGIPCGDPYVCNPFGVDGFECTETCTDYCPPGFSCITTIDPTSSKLEIKVCSNGDECNKFMPCLAPEMCYVTSAGNRCGKGCLFTSDCEPGQTCKRVVDPINIGNVLFVCTPIGYPQCDSLNLCTYPQGCNPNTFTCERQPGYGEGCYSKGVACKVGYVCNSFTIVNSMYTCTKACSLSSDCKNGGKCTSKADPTNGFSIKVCSSYGNTCVLGKCPQYQLCNMYTYKCYDDPRYICQDKITRGRNGCKALINFCNKPEFCEFMTQNCKKTCNRCYSSYTCPIPLLRTTTQIIPYHHNIHLVLARARTFFMPRRTHWIG